MSKIDSLTFRFYILGALAVCLAVFAAIMHPNPLKALRDQLIYLWAILISCVPFLVALFVISLHHPQATHGGSDFQLIVGSWVIATGISSSLIGYYKVRRVFELWKTFIPVVFVAGLLPGPRSSDLGAYVFFALMVAQIPSALVGGYLGLDFRLKMERAASVAEKH